MASQHTPETDKLVVEGLYWWGVPTLFRCPHVPDPSQCDIALVGVPHSTGNGTTERDQHMGPRAVRDVSAMTRRAHMGYGFIPWEACRIHDLGDVPLPATPVRLSRTPGGIRHRAPMIGEHTDEIMRELGYNDADIAALREENVI